MPEVTIVTPTYCEAANLPLLFGRLKAALGRYDWELQVVDDDSPDGTAEVARSLAQDDNRMRVIQRIRRRGLSGAVVEGMMASSSPYLAVIDADLQHDEGVLPQMIDMLRDRRDLQVVVGTRYATGGETEGLNGNRLKMSRLATRLASLVTRTPVSDPMSGFFAIRRDVFLGVSHKLSDQGFKILLDILASSATPLKVGEVAYRFRNREFGTSKLDSAVLWQYAELLFDKSFGRWVPVRMVRFALVGGVGLGIHFATLFTAFKVFEQPFLYSQIAATMVAMTSNYFLNNLFTFKDRRLKGWRSLLGLLSFYVVCSVGAIANVGVASYAFQERTAWWLAAISGILVGTVWNYAVSASVTWGKKR